MFCVHANSNSSARENVGIQNLSRNLKGGIPVYGLTT
jgi:hypothetical protein